MTQSALRADAYDRWHGEGPEAVWERDAYPLPARAAPMFKRRPPQDKLSPEQRRFAEEHDAVAGLHAGPRRQLVFFYRYERASTHRWLVDEAGEVVDFVALR